MLNYNRKQYLCVCGRPVAAESLVAMNPFDQQKRPSAFGSCIRELSETSSGFCENFRPTAHTAVETNLASSAGF